jgi:hypothetical protein
MSFLFLSMIAHSQINKSGVYLNVADYETKKLTYEIDCSEEKHKIKLNEFFNKPYITVVHNGYKYTHQKKDIY